MEAHRIETHVPATSALVLEPAAPRARPGHYVLAVLLALAGGVLGIFGAFFGELRAGLSPLIIFVGAPVIEEIVKLIDEDADIAVLVLAAGVEKEGPGPLVTQLVSKGGGTFPVPITVVPGSLDDAAIAAIT